MLTLVINSGSSSLKYALFAMPKEQLLTEWHIENIGFQDGVFEHEDYTPKGKTNTKFEEKKNYKDHQEAIQNVLQTLIEDESLPISDVDNIDIVWHRVVHGGEEFHKPILISNTVIKAIKKYIELAPLHNPANLKWVQTCQKLIPHAKQIAIFDTAFHQTMKPENFLYALPYEFYTKHKIRRYGFHGISHQYVSQKAKKILKNTQHTTSSIKLISCHVGNGASITAIQDGKVIENSLWLTTVSGLIMGTRSGDIDPWVITYLIKNKIVKGVKELEEILYKKSGVLWISWFTNHLKNIVDEHQKGNSKATLTLTMYINQIVKYIGAYAALMNWVNAIIFTAGVLEKSYPQPELIRKMIVQKLAYLWIELDSEANKNIGEYKIITNKKSKIPIIVIPTNEELMIAQQSYELISNW